MAKHQKSYPPEFKQQIVDLYHTRNYSYPQLEREYSIEKSTISKWVHHLSPIKVSESETITMKEFKALQKENQRLKIENEILKKRPSYSQKNNRRTCNFYSKQRYGAVKICRTLHTTGIPFSLKRVQRHMVAKGLRSVVEKKYKHHTNHGAVPDKKENLLNRNFKADTIHQKWCTDITLHSCIERRMDLCSRKIIGYAYGTSMTAELAIEAVKNACLNVKETKGILLHSDFKEAQMAIFEYIESWYNRKRIHRAINYMTPQQKEDMELKKGT